MQDELQIIQNQRLTGQIYKKKMLKPQSIRKGTSIKLNGKDTEKQEIIDLSSDWTEAQENLFKKMLKQGGEITIKGVHIKIVPKEKVLTSNGEKDPGILVVKGLD